MKKRGRSNEGLLYITFYVFRRIYPQNGNEAYYEKFYTDSASLFSETAASKARQLCAKYNTFNTATKTIYSNANYLGFNASK